MKIKDNTQILQSELDQERNYLIVKHNDLVQKARFNLSVQEQKIILYIISKLKPDTINFDTQDLSIIDFCRVCGIDYDNGGNYKTIKDTVKGLRDKSIWVTLDENTETTLSWISKVTINKKSGLIKIRLDDDMKPYLLGLHEKFFRYNLIYTLPMRSQYSIRLYEIFKSYEWRRKCKFDIDKFKKILFAEKYLRFPDFKRYVLDIAIKEINNLSDLVIEYEIIKKGRKYTGIEFLIRKKESVQESMLMSRNISVALGGA